MIKERPILFSAPMVRAILEGRKTQTRRAFSERMVKLMAVAANCGEVSHFLNEKTLGEHDLAYIVQFCPYGKPGDRLWVKETWSKAKSSMSSELFYRADGETNGKQYALSFVERELKWRLSIHMPRWASRILLEITGVRVERLNDISEEDAIAEGCRSLFVSSPDNPTGKHEVDGYSAAEDYYLLWESINGTGSWDLNPWVWILEFNVISK